MDVLTVTSLEIYTSLARVFLGAFLARQLVCATMIEEI
jgi:hypothetical protein